VRVLEKLAIGLPRKLKDRAAARGPLPEPTTPVDGGRGALPRLDAGSFDGASRLGAATAAMLEGVDWAVCPDTGARLPQQHRAALDLDPGAWHEARLLHRHSWFSTLARAYADTGDASFARAATKALASWLATDRPQVGVGWIHASDAGERLVHWVLGAAWLDEELDADLWRRMAGSAAAHGAFLRGADPGESDFRLLGSACGLVVAGLAWPGLGGSRAWWSEGLVLLSRHLPASLHGDGVPRDGSPARLQRVLEMVLVTRQLARANGVAFPADAEHALGQGAWVLRVLAADTGELPLLGAGSPAFTPAWGDVPAFRAWDEVAPDRGADPAGEALAASTEWAMTAFREGGWIVLHSSARGACSRAVVTGVQAHGLGAHADVAQVVWHLGDLPVLADPGDAPGHAELSRAHVHNGLVYNGVGAGDGRPSGARVRKARADGRAAAVAVEHDAFAGVSLEREVLFEGTRIAIVDKLGDKARGSVELRFTLGPGWALEEGEKGWSAEHPSGRKLAVKLDSSLRWSLTTGPLVLDGAVVDAPLLHGVGQASGATRIRNTFEIRA